MITEQERETFTAALWSKHGADLPRYIAERIGELAVAQDAGGVAFWRDIATRANVMMSGTRQ